MSKHKYNWRPDLPDMRDWKYAAPRVRGLPTAVNLSHRIPLPVFDQGDLGSCTGNATATAFMYADMKNAKKPGTITPSRLFLYYNGRDYEGTTAWDAGAEIRDVVKGAHNKGACTEAKWTYNINKFATKPPAGAYTQALSHQVLSYHRVDNTSLGQMRGCLASGWPFIFGFTVYESFESPEVEATGRVPMPGQDEAVLGGHAVVAMGYYDKDRTFWVQNSWGTEWGHRGFFYLPYEYLLNEDLASDCWTLRTVEE